MNPALDGGEIRLRLALRQELVSWTDVASTRPRVERLLIGQPAETAVQRVPLLFAVCGRAQGHAARLALAAARGVETPPQLVQAVEVEVMREHLWRLLLDLPPGLGLEPQTALFQAAWQALGAGDRSALSALLGADYWNHLMQALTLLDELPAARSPGGPLLPVMSASQSLAAWPHLDATFARQPTWRGAPAETSAFARWGGQNPAAAGALAARWHARSAEVWSYAAGEAQVGAGGTASAAQMAPGIGRALVETARGLLMHEITLADDTVSDYVIVAPTEWNFHPRGVLDAWLCGLRGDGEELRDSAQQVVAALDPCVRWRIELN